MPSSTPALSLLILLAALGPVDGAEPPAERFAGQIQACNEAATAARNAIGELAGMASDIPAFSQGDMRLITAYTDELAALWTSAASALEQGNEPAAEAFIRRAREMEGKRDLWRQRLAWRRSQAPMDYLAPTEESFDALVGDQKPHEIGEIEAFIEAKKLRSEAYGRLADAAKPDADPRLLEKLQDEVFAADVEVQVANMKREWAHEDRSTRLLVTNDPTVASPQYAAAIERLAQWRRDYEKAYRQSRAVEHDLEVRMRQYKSLFEARSEAYRAAKAARDAAQGTGK